MSKVAVIGIDGLDPFLLNEWKEKLPNMGQLFKKTSDISIESTFPPDSICAWTSIFTGENPAEHGLIESIDYLSSKKISENKERSMHFKGRTFWDMASRNMKTVCIINPFLAYPAWEVNGIMVSGPVFEGGEISAYPKTVLDKYTFPPIGGIVDFPEERDLGDFVTRTREVTQQLADTGIELYRDSDPDLFFLTFLTLDRLKHFLWRFTDKDDRYYPGENSFSNSIREFYIMLDSIIGRFMEIMDKDTTLVIISDHGHRRRCTKCLNINEILRQKGYLETSARGASGGMKKAVERTKVAVVSTLTRMNLQDWIYKIAKFIPNRKALKKSTYLIDKTSSTVTISNLCGANPYGGLDIHVRSGGEYEMLREKMINELYGLNEITGKNIVKWAGKREDVYTGKYEDRMPDVLFELEEEYGVGMDLYTAFVSDNYTHRKISGGHKMEAVLLISSNNYKIKNMIRPSTLMGFNNYILEILDIKNRI